jgi:molybdopterin/thiamine biosynthesis adenylyltransferase/rhodanese-related sulfurtransferase
MLSDHDKKRYARQLALKEFGAEAQEKLLLASVLVVGAGGLGCPALLYLAGAGIGNIGIVDHDTVSLSNLHRQILYKVSDIGKNKAACAAGTLHALNPGISITVYPHALSTENAFDIISSYDIIIDGTDHFSTRYLVNDACVLMKKPLVYAAVSGFEGQVAVFNQMGEQGNRSVNYRDLFPVPPQEEMIPNCEEAGVLGVLPGIIGTMQANEAIKIISGVGQSLANQLLTYNALYNQVFSFEISKSSSTMSMMPLTKEEFERKDYVLECADPAKAHFTIDMAHFEQMKDRDDVIVIDVRETGEMPEVTEFRHIHIPLSRLKDEMNGIKENTIIAFCQVGQRSLIAARAMADFFGNTKKVYSLGGGIVNWKKSFEHEGEKA